MDIELNFVEYNAFYFYLNNNKTLDIIKINFLLHRNIFSPYYITN